MTNLDVMKTVFKVMKDHPQLRFCQILSNCFPAGTDLYYIPNEEIIKRLKEYYGDQLNEPR